MMEADAVFSRSPIIPVITINSVDAMLHLAEALIKGGIDIFEITLRTPVALEATKAVRAAFPGALCGVGTVLNAATLTQSQEAGAQFAISPGLTPSLADAAKTASIPLIPGVNSASTIMQALEYNFNYLKLFPASVVGGIAALKAYGAVFSSVHFCPTGGVNASNANDYLALKNVDTVGGSWIVPTTLIEEKAFDQITQLCQTSLQQLQMQ